MKTQGVTFLSSGVVFLSGTTSTMFFESLFLDDLVVLKSLMGGAFTSVLKKDSILSF